MPSLQQPEMQNDTSSQTTHRKSTEAVKRYFGRYFLIFEFILTVIVYTVLLAVGCMIFTQVFVAFYTVAHFKVADVESLIDSFNSSLHQGLCFLMFHCHVAFINAFASAALIWFVLAVLIKFSEHERAMLLLTMHDNELIVVQ